MSLYAVTTYFNSAKYQTKLNNYRLFREQLAVPLITVELSFDGEFELAATDADVMVQLHGGAVLWQKERLMNVALAHLPPDCTAVAWIDNDVLFDSDSWAEQAQQKLKQYPMVQLFSRSVDLRPGETDISAEPEYYAQGLIARIESKGISALERQSKYSWGHPRREVMPGLAWCIRRDVIDQHGFYDAMIMGAADRMFLHAAYGEISQVPTTVLIPEPHFAHYLKWAQPFYNTVQGSVGYIDHTAYHLWHGEIPNRRYWDRHDAVVKMGFDPDTDIKHGDNGAWHWARPCPELERYCIDYFQQRLEDGND
jgi:hypothetical protein